ncbi:PREDICTED: kinesin-like protein KIF13A [Priapulus caudatus]|uniref:Kinesin-like protein KIF13A n=1 Tax=Priapulus caudatus TaxID=37621 RepID=A0ABM1E797_PRICU|nr:PREDICTED: kinesin-like protein KIF13A [Priapulus caudatus]
MSSKVKVAVRVRPFSRREYELGTKCVVDMVADGGTQQVVLYHPSSSSAKAGDSRKTPKTFAFDNCFWSIDEKDPKYTGQENVYNSLGVDVLVNALEGYNACIFAYGQTGSGKSYSMMGNADNKGIIPRICDSLFESIAANKDDPNLRYNVEVSYMEIYNEKVRDLLDPNSAKSNLRVREHNILGPYVDGLSTLVVSNFKDIDNLMSEGNKSRTVAATNMNSESSRSHAVFNIKVTQILTDPKSGVSGEKVSKVSLVDLAGSERAQKSGAVGERLKEGSNINKSLTTLGLVISALADQAAAGSKNKNKFVPYRDSVLTWLLKDNLGGNSRTVMIATVSPANDNYEETLSTLRYADRAKRIVNHAVVNEDPNAKIIRELRSEVEHLRVQLKESKQSADLQEKLQESEKLMSEITRSWEEKLSATEQIHVERQQAMEKMGISVQTSGIRVEKDKYYLVNLNADPSLNELLVYYLKDHTLVGGPNAPVEQDIQLSGLGIMPEHCIVDIVDGDVFMSPLEGARTCVNGSVIKDQTLLKHGDRVLWGNHHFFRINCPKPAMSALERQKQMYEQQLQKLRSQISPNTPTNPYGSFGDLRGVTSPSNANVNARYKQWAEEKDKVFKASLTKLREEVVRANAITREANYLSEELARRTEFHVTLQIPAANLSPNRKRGAFVSEPAILVKRKNKSKQVWSLEKLENKIIDMRELYEERKEKGLPLKDEVPVKGYDPFYESQENHNLIGVANVFLEVLFHDAKLDYQVPIISQQGEVAGRLHVELSRTAGTLGSDRMGDAEIDEMDINKNNIDDDSNMPTSHITVKLVIKEASGLPPHLSNFVFCQYNFWGESESVVVAPDINPDGLIQIETPKRGATFHFNHEKELVVQVADEFLEHCMEGALSVEVWGHRSSGFGTSILGWEMDSINAKTRSLSDRWREVKRRLELWVEIHELNEHGEYAPVENVVKPEIFTGGVFQLRQGHSRRILVRVKAVPNSGTLPLICDCIKSISIGSVCVRSKLQKSLDSYQEIDLDLLKNKWSEALGRRREYLDEQIQKIINKPDKSDADIDRERSLIDQWVCLTEERNAVLVPTAGSGIPGEPADWSPPAGLEQHIPVIFLDLNADDMSTSNVDGLQGAGINSILPKEHGTKFYSLPIVKFSEHEVCSLCSWDSSIHDSPYLNRVTPPNERIYLILKATVQLSHPGVMELVLRKRICINVYKRQSFTEKLFKKIGMQWDTLHACGVQYEIVSNIPKASEDPEDRESLALMAAASGASGDQEEGQSYIERYIHGVSAVESILALDRLRQEVAVKEMLAVTGKPIRKTASVPNISNISRFHSESSLTELAPTSRLEVQCRADSVMELHRMSPDFSIPSHQYVTSWEKEFRRKSLSDTFRKQKDRDRLTPTKDLKGTFPGLARPTFLNIRPQTYVNNKSKSASPKSGASPVQPAKIVKALNLTTLLEEQQQKDQSCSQVSNDRHEFDEEEEEEEAEEGEDDDEEEEEECLSSPSKYRTRSPEQFPLDTDDAHFSSYSQQQQQQQQQQPQPQTHIAKKSRKKDAMSHSNTIDSLTEAGGGRPLQDLPRSGTVDSLTDVKNLPGSVTSSGYCSHGFSSHTLSSEDSISLRSISVDETPDVEAAGRSKERGEDGEEEDPTAVRLKEEEEQEKEYTATARLQEEEEQEKEDGEEEDHTAMRLKEEEEQEKEYTATTRLQEEDEQEKEDGEEEDHTAMRLKEEEEEKGKEEEYPAATRLQEEEEQEEEEKEKEDEYLAAARLQEEEEQKEEKEKEEEYLAAARLQDEEEEEYPTAARLQEKEEKEEDGEVEQKNPECTEEIKEECVSSEAHEGVDEGKGDSASSPECAEDGKEESSSCISQEHGGEMSEAGCNLMDSDIPESINAPIQPLTPLSHAVHDKPTHIACNTGDGDEDTAENERSFRCPLTGDIISDFSPFTSTSEKPNVELEDRLDADAALDGLLPPRDADTQAVADSCSLSVFDPANVKQSSHDGSTANDSLVFGNDDGTHASSTEPTSAQPECLQEQFAGVQTAMEESFSEGNPQWKQGDIELLGHKALIDEEKLSGTDSDECSSICSFGSRADLHRMADAPVPSWITVGEPVVVMPYTACGVIKFVGTTEFAAGNWVGVELDKPAGKNDGSVKGVRYFSSKPLHGMFVRHDKLEKRRRKSGATTPGSAAAKANRNSWRRSRAEESSSFMKPTASSFAKKSGRH